MSGYIEGISRDQVTLFPDRLEDWIDEDHPVRMIDAFVDARTLSARASAACHLRRPDAPLTTLRCC
jgi:hypothetical protein